MNLPESGSCSLLYLLPSRWSLIYFKGDESEHRAWYVKQCGASAGAAVPAISFPLPVRGDYTYD